MIGYQKNYPKIMSTKITKLIAASLICLGLLSTAAYAVELNIETSDTYLKAVIGSDQEVEAKKSSIFDGSQSFIPNPDRSISYEWDFGDGNRNEGIEVLHAYKEPGHYVVTLTINDGEDESTSELEVFAYHKMIILITDQRQAEERIRINEDFALENDVYIKKIESFGSSTEFISEEILTKKLTEESHNIQKAKEIIIWTKENAGLNALSRYIQTGSEKYGNQLAEKTLLVLENDINDKISRIQRQFKLINPKQIIITQEAAMNALIVSTTDEEFINTLQERGHIYELISPKSGKLRPWNFMSYFVNVLINQGIPDNTIALLLLLPVIATVVAFMRQFIGITTFGIYTPSIITLSFLVIGMYAGLLTLLTAIFVGSLTRPLLKKFRMLFIPKMAIVITLVSLSLLLILTTSIYLKLFDAAFLSIAIFPMLILSTLVEKFVSAKTDKSLWSASFLMGETLLVAIVAYFIAGGEIDLGVVVLKLEFIKRMMLNHPEIVFLLIAINVGLGKWNGLRVLERVRFREILRHIEE